MLNAGASSKALGHHLTRQSLNIGRKRATVPVRAYASWSERESSSPFSMEPRDWYPEPRKGPNGPNSRNDHSGRSGRSATTSQDRQRRRPPKTLPFGRFNRTGPPPHLLTLADLSLEEINSLLRSSLSMKKAISTFSQHHFPQHFANGTVALLFTKRSTRTRVASETAANMLGANAMFLGASDIQLGVNESLQDTAKVVGSMVEGFMARVDRHEDVEVSFSCHICLFSPLTVNPGLGKRFPSACYQCPVRPLPPDTDSGRCVDHVRGMGRTRQMAGRAGSIR